MPWERCGLKVRNAMRTTVVDLLSGVGSGDPRRDRGAAVLHFRRRLSDAEIALLSPAWCAIPAVGMAGDGIPW